jgi:hypothetical protein
MEVYNHGSDLQARRDGTARRGSSNASGIPTSRTSQRGNALCSSPSFRRSESPRLRVTIRLGAFSVRAAARPPGFAEHGPAPLARIASRLSPMRSIQVFQTGRLRLRGNRSGRPEGFRRLRFPLLEAQALEWAGEKKAAVAIFRRCGAAHDIKRLERALESGDRAAAFDHAQDGGEAPRVRLSETSHLVSRAIRRIRRSKDRV